ncbi:MAG: DUF520 family protein, partial [Chloroflexaceae bacterium]|nr:DUF520 family protein [Chloroflexaceae bacterium]
KPCEKFGARYDLKDTKTTVELGAEAITINTDSDFTLDAVHTILQTKAAKRQLSLKIFDYGKVESASGNRVRQEIKLQKGISSELAKQISKLIRDEFKKVQPSIQGDAVHGPCDAHFWLNPNNVMIWADNIAAALAEIDPDNADFYRANAATYKEQLRVLDAEVEAILEVIPLENRRLVTNHDFLGYFARRYGFEIVGVVLPGGSTLAEPSSRDLAELIEIIEREGIQTIIVEASNVNRISDTLAEQVGIETILLYSDSLSDADGPTPTYIDYMRYNAQAIAAVLGETP